MIEAKQYRARVVRDGIMSSETEQVVLASDHVAALAREAALIQSNVTMQALLNGQHQDTLFRLKQIDALQQRLSETDRRLNEATQRVRESQAELLEMKVSGCYRGFTLGVIGRNDHFLSQLTKDSPEVGS